MRTSRLRVTLREVTPAVERVIDVPASGTLPELHELLQAALGWTDSHLHQFVTDDATYGIPDAEWADELGEQDESAVKLRDLPPAFLYRYDFGDDWEHDVEVLGRGADRPGCVDGQGGCPPEDCGGPSGYAELLAVLADPDDEEHEHMRAWAGELPTFDRAAADLLVRQTVGEVPASVRLVLDLLAGGVKLTPGGRLPRKIVRQVQQQRPGWYPLGRPASLEEDLLPLADLHEMLRRVGLLRLANGVLRPTRAAADDLQTIRRLRSWFEPGGFIDILTGVAVATLETSGPLPADELAAHVFPLLEGRWSVDGRPLTEADVQSQLRYLGAQLEALDLIDRGDRRIWRAGPSARTLLPRITALAQLWTPPSRTTRL